METAEYRGQAVDAVDVAVTRFSLDHAVGADDERVA